MGKTIIEDTTQLNFGRLLVYVHHDGYTGPILEASGVFVEDVLNFGRDISDHDMPNANNEGLLIFEGFIEHTAGPDPDLFFCGEWRNLTHWEMCRVRVGLSPWDEKVKS